MTDGVFLAPFDRRHLDATRRWANDPELARFLDRGRPIGDLEHEKWYEAIQGRSDCLFFAVELKEEWQHVGNVWFWDICARHRRAELRIVIGDPQGRDTGIGSHVIEMATKYAFERLNLRKVYAYVLGSNPRGLRAFEKSGYVQEGQLREDRWVGGEYVDVHLLAKIRH